MVKLACIIALIPSAVLTALGATVDTTSVATPALEERTASEICGPILSPTQVSAIVIVYDDEWYKARLLNDVITLSAGSCVYRTLGKSAKVAWSTPDAIVYIYKNTDCTGDRVKIDTIGDETVSYRSIKVFAP